jgi:hypothetical protein
VRIIIEFDDTGRGPPTVTAVSSAESGAPPGALTAPEATDAGPPADGQPLGEPAQGAVGGLAVHAGEAPAVSTGPAGASSISSGGGGNEESIDAGGSPNLD